MGRTTDSTLRWSGVSHTITTNSVSAQSAAFGAYTTEIRVVSNTNCHINIGTDPTAVASANNGIYLPTGVVEYFHVSPGQKLAVIRDTVDGVTSVAEMTR